MRTKYARSDPRNQDPKGDFARRTRLEAEIDALKMELIELRSELVKSGMERLALIAENEKLRADAGRYGWLKSNCFYYEEPCEAYAAGVLHFESTELTQIPDSLDSVLDAAMKDFSTRQKEEGEKA